MMRGNKRVASESEVSALEEEAETEIAESMGDIREILARILELNNNLIV